jgi:hypothetical protein
LRQNLQQVAPNQEKPHTTPLHYLIYSIYISVIVAFINIDIVICSTPRLPCWFLLSCIVLPDLSPYNIQFVYFVLVTLSYISVIATILQ